MPILRECNNCHRLGGYAKSAEADVCARCEQLGEPTPKSKKSKKDEEDE